MPLPDCEEVTAKPLNLTGSDKRVGISLNNILHSGAGAYNLIQDDAFKA